VVGSIAIAAGPLLAHKLGLVFVVIGIVGAGLITVMSLLFPARLTLDPGYLALKWGLTSQRWSWSDVSNFRLGHLGAISFDALERVTYEDDPDYFDETPPVVPGWLGYGWDLETIGILEEARGRWANNGANHPA
jgi:hypothetical protein